MNELRDCYNELHKIIGDSIEPFESVELVEKYRRFWRPEKVKIILLAESHVLTSGSDRKISLREVKELPAYPTEYAKFVYCLAYGERQLTNNSSHPKRDGTPQFWKIFYSCNNRVDDIKDFRPILSYTPAEQRLKNKIELLKSLKGKGIWLVDASIVALYDNGGKPSRDIMFKVIKKSWDCYTSSVIKAAGPERIICIGKDVDSMLGESVRKIIGSHRYTSIPQPNARLSSEEHMDNFKLYCSICSN
jgi:hypothetical protein